jgi:hypothetical protein
VPRPRKTKNVLIGRRNEAFIEFGDKPDWYILASAPSSIGDEAIDHPEYDHWVALDYTSIQVLDRATAEREKLENAAESESARV